MMLIIDAGGTDTDCFISLYNVRTPKTYQNSVVCEFKCPGCNGKYVGKTDRCMYTRIKENSSHDSFEIHNHIISCQLYTEPTETNILRRRL